MTEAMAIDFETETKIKSDNLFNTKTETGTTLFRLETVSIPKPQSRGRITAQTYVTLYR